MFYYFSAKLIIYKKNSQFTLDAIYSPLWKCSSSVPIAYTVLIQYEEFEDTKGVIRIRKSKDRQHNGQKKKDKRTNNDIQNIHIKLKIE